VISPSEADTCLDRARSEVKRWGGSEASLTHLAAVLAVRWGSEFEAVFGADGQEQVHALLTNQRYIGTEQDIGALLANPDYDEKTLLVALRDRLAPEIADLPGQEAVEHASAAPDDGEAAEQSEVDGSESTPAESSGPGTTAGRLPQVVSLIAPRDDVVHRDREIETIAVALTRREPRIVALLGERGSGRRAIMHGVAALLAGLAEPLPVARLRQDPTGGAARNLARALSTIKEPMVLVLEDFEALSRLDSPSASGEVLELVRAAQYHPYVRLVLVLRPRSVSRLETLAGTVADNLVRVNVSSLAEGAVRQVVDAHFAAIADHYGVSINTAVVDAACRPATSADVLAHPALALDRLDKVAARRRLLGGGEALPDDVENGADYTPVMPSAGELAEQLSARVKGQDAAIKIVAERLALTRARLDLRPERPDGVFLFVGPTGVGKTELAREISRCVFGSTANLIRLDMSEYSQDFAVTRLFGPPPGYVGATEPENWLTTRIAAMPQCVLLLDEIEKAHPSIWNSFLQVFDAGRLTDSRGLTADFSTVIIVMTSNLGAVQAGKSVGFTPSDDPNERRARRQLDAVKDQLAPELVNRLDEIVPFDPLSQDAIAAIAQTELTSAIDRLNKVGWQVECEPGVARYLADTGYDPNYGARHLQRNLERLFLMPLSRQSARSVRVIPDGEGIVISEI
jgi:hypothetical protein